MFLPHRVLYTASQTHALDFCGVWGGRSWRVQQREELLVCAAKRGVGVCSREREMTL